MIMLGVSITLIIICVLYLLRPFPSSEFVCSNIELSNAMVKLDIGLCNSSMVIKSYKCHYINGDLFITLVTGLNWRSKTYSYDIIFSYSEKQQTLNKIYVRTSFFSKYELVWEKLLEEASGII